MRPGPPRERYKVFLARELRLRGVSVRTEVAIPVTYRGETVQLGLRFDMLVDEALVVELKTVPSLLPVHRAQVLSYLRLSGHRLALLLNFHASHLKDGIERFVNDEPWELP